MRLARVVGITIAFLLWLAGGFPGIAVAQRTEAIAFYFHRISIAPEAPRAGQAATVAVSLARRDAGTRPVDLVVRFQVEGTARPFAERRVTLAPGQTQRISVPWRASAGQATIAATAALAARTGTVVARARRLVVVAPAAEARRRRGARPAAPAAPRGPRRRTGSLAEQRDGPRRAARRAGRHPARSSLPAIRTSPPATLRVAGAQPHVATTDPLRAMSTINRAVTTDALVVRASP